MELETSRAFLNCVCKYAYFTLLTIYSTGESANSINIQQRQSWKHYSQAAWNALSVTAAADIKSDKQEHIRQPCNNTGMSPRRKNALLPVYLPVGSREWHQPCLIYSGR